MLHAFRTVIEELKNRSWNDQIWGYFSLLCLSLQWNGESYSLFSHHESMSNINLLFYCPPNGNWVAGISEGKSVIFRDADSSLKPQMGTRIHTLFTVLKENGWSNLSNCMNASGLTLLRAILIVKDFSQNCKAR